MTLRVIENERKRSRSGRVVEYIRPKTTLAFKVPRSSFIYYGRSVQRQRHPEAPRTLKWMPCNPSFRGINTIPSMGGIAHASPVQSKVCVALQSQYPIDGRPAYLRRRGSPMKTNRLPLAAEKPVLAKPLRPFRCEICPPRQPT